MTKQDKLLDAIGQVDEKLIPELSPRRKNRKVIFISSIAVVCAAALLLATLFPPKFLANLLGRSSEKLSAQTLASPNYPTMAEYPDESKYADWDLYDKAVSAWNESRDALRNQPTGYQTGYDAFFRDVTPTLIDPDTSENVAFSPMSLYLALSMSAEITDGQSRQQILDVLHQKDILSSRANAKSLFEANFVDDKMGKCLLANSLWTNSKCTYDQATMNILADHYYASAFTGDPLSPKYTTLYRAWINNQTDGLLSDFVNELSLDPQMVLTLVSTVNYEGKWSQRFDPEKTKASTFHGQNGDITCDFMKNSYETMFSRGENFDSIDVPLESNGYMRLILPNEGIRPAALLQDKECMDFLMNKDSVAEKRMTVNLSLPKFDIASSLKLNENLKKLGITEIFDATRANFAPLGSDSAEGLAITTVQQDARILIDEEGCKASAVTIMELCGSAMPPDDKIDLVFDRPFLVEIVSDTGAPLFIGIVNQPAD